MDGNDSFSSKGDSFESNEASIEHDSKELHRAFHHKSVEGDSRPKFDSVEEDHDFSHKSYGKIRREEPQEADHDHDVDSVTNESAERVHRVEDNEIEY